MIPAHTRSFSSVITNFPLVSTYLTSSPPWKRRNVGVIRTHPRFLEFLFSHVSSITSRSDFDGKWNSVLILAQRE